MRNVLFVAILCGAASVSHSVHADSPTIQAEPPSFSSIAAIKNYWNANPPSNRNVVFVDGVKVNATLGFGPSSEQQYFRCSVTNNYRRACNGPYDNASTWEHITRHTSQLYTVYWDGNLVRQGDPNASAHITTCYGDTDGGFPGPIPFYRLTHLSSGGTVQYVSQCP